MGQAFAERLRPVFSPTTYQEAIGNLGWFAHQVRLYKERPRGVPWRNFRTDLSIAEFYDTLEKSTAQTPLTERLFPMWEHQVRRLSEFSFKLLGREPGLSPVVKEVQISSD